MELKALIEQMEFDLLEIQNDDPMPTKDDLIKYRNNFDMVIKGIQVIEELLGPNKKNGESSVLLNELYRKFVEQKKLIYHRVFEFCQSMTIVQGGIIL